jgi:hypothetical protein
LRRRLLLRAWRCWCWATSRLGSGGEEGEVLVRVIAAARVLAAVAEKAEKLG